jgi:hypothetical protein
MTKNKKDKEERLELLFKEYNTKMQSLRKMINEEVPNPFTIDGTMKISLWLDKPLDLNPLIASEVFSSDALQIIAVDINDGVMTFKLKSATNELEHRIELSERTIALWEAYLIFQLILGDKTILEKIKEQIDKVNIAIAILNGVKSGIHDAIDNAMDVIEQ